MLRKREDWIKMCRENLTIKILAFSLATVTIYSIQRITNQTDEFEVPIQIEVGPGMTVSEQDARYAYVTCRGSLDDLRRLDQSQLRLVVRPRIDVPTGRPEVVPIGLRNVQGVPRSITVTKVRPNILSVILDREIEKQITVARPELIGRPALGRAEVEFNPKIVTVRGPQQLLADLKIIQTPAIDVENASVSFSRELPILADEEAGVWDVIPRTISARVSIVTEAINREWADLPLMLLRATHANLTFTTDPPTVSVSLLGSPQIINEIETSDIRVFIDCSKITEPGTHELPATVFVDRGTDIRSAVTPPMIQVTAKRLLPAGIITNDLPAEARQPTVPSPQAETNRVD